MPENESERPAMTVDPEKIAEAIRYLDIAHDRLVGKGKTHRSDCLFTDHVAVECTCGSAELAKAWMILHDARQAYLDYARHFV